MDLAAERERVQQWEADQRVAKLCYWIHKIGHFKEHLSWEQWIEGTDLHQHPDAPPGGSPQRTNRPTAEYDELLDTDELRGAFDTLQALGVNRSGA